MLYRGAYLLSGEGGNQPEVLSFFRHGWKECGTLASYVKEKRSRVTSMEENIRGVLVPDEPVGFCAFCLLHCGNPALAAVLPSFSLSDAHVTSLWNCTN